MTTAEMEALFSTATAATELAEKTASEIQVDASYHWAGRAVVAYRMYHKAGDPAVRDQAVEYAHEALEHAAMALDGGRTLRLVEYAITEELTRLGGL